MRLRIDPDRCQGHAVCALVAPTLIELSDDDGHAVAQLDEIPSDELVAAEQAAAGCPEQAISIEQ